MGRPMTDAERQASIARAIADGRAAPMPPEHELAERRAAIEQSAEHQALKYGAVSLGGLAAAAAQLSGTDVPDYVGMAKEDAAAQLPPAQPWTRPQRTAAELRAILKDAAEGMPPLGSPAWELLQTFQRAGDDLGVYGVQLRVREQVPALKRMLRAQERREWRATKRMVARNARDAEKQRRRDLWRRERERREEGTLAGDMRRWERRARRLPG